MKHEFHVTVYAYVYRRVLAFLRFGVLIYRAVAVKSWRCAKKVADDPSVPLDCMCACLCVCVCESVCVCVCVCVCACV